MAKNWNENKQLLYEIIDEMVVHESSVEHKQRIVQFYDSLMSDLYKKQYSFQNYTELNKHVLSEVNTFLMTLHSGSNSTNHSGTQSINIQDLQPQFQQPSQSVTREDIHGQRESIFKQRLQEKQNEMDMFQKKPVKDIDFTDKTEESNESIDNLLERELARRNMEFEYDSSVQQKASDWITNTSSAPIDGSSQNIVKSDMTIFHEPPKLKIHDEPPKSALKHGNETNEPKQVHFEVSTPIDTLIKDKVDSPNSPVVTNNLLLKLNQIKKNREVNRDVLQNGNTIIQSKSHAESMNESTYKQTFNSNDLYKEVKQIQTELGVMKNNIDFIMKKLVELCSYVEKENVTIEQVNDDA